MSGINLLEGVGGTAVGVAQAVAPLLVLVIIFQMLFLRLPVKYVINLLVGTLIAAAGLLLFLQGVSAGFLPFGRIIGEALGSLNPPWFLIPLGFLFGFATTYGEPAVRILCDQVEEASARSIPSSTVLYTISAGEAVFVALGMARITHGIPLLYILIPGYILVIILLWVSDKEFMSIALDAGGVASGPIANTFLLGLALGLASVAAKGDPIVYGLGLVSLVSLAPIISVMLLGLVFRMRIG